MSAVTIAVLVGFVCCALVIRVLGSRAQPRRPQVVVVAGDRAERWRTNKPGTFDV
ncbi:hypothetical protein OH799_14780 [Nocardia sp. NBC_00881]|uniref:hypothetical protein n=1 Tax=Nocardia sp. NBC_00881 TaxID=2975995 RepID=UPI003864EF76|nr:hypothetical protein OH799_14780 [Nocardia sp. NBC_00881]